MAAPFLALSERSLRFAWHSGDVTPIRPPHSTGWRTLPGAVVAQPLGARVLVRFGPGREVAIGDGDCLCVPAGTPHRIDLTHGDGVSRWALASFEILGAIDALSLYAVPTRYAGTSAGRLGALCQRLARTSPPSTVTDVIARQSLGLRLLEEIVAQAPLRADAALAAARVDRMRPALELIHAHYQRRLTLAELARPTGLSRSRFHAWFRAAVGCAPMDYVQRLRMQEAQRLLITTDDTVATIADGLGFADQFQFSRLFKRRCGTSPSAYRAQVRADLMPTSPKPR